MPVLTDTHIGFTGTRKGMTERQKEALREFLLPFAAACNFHHGDCIGADEEAHDIAWDLGLWVTIHPPVDDTRRAHCERKDYKRVTVLDPAEFIVRNHDIVDATTHLIGAPDSVQEQKRSGTWATIRYGQARERFVKVIYPEGAGS